MSAREHWRNRMGQRWRLLIMVFVLVVAGFAVAWSPEGGPVAEGVEDSQVAARGAGEAAVVPGSAPLERRTKRPRRYVALGDSYASAPKFGGISREPSGCAHGLGNYPARVAKALEVREYIDVSCSGARTRNMFEPQQRKDGGFSPAQRAALTPRTDLVTITMGANDRSLFARVFSGCVEANRSRSGSPHPCRDRFTVVRDGRRVDLLKQVAIGAEDRLLRVLREVKRRSPRARVLVVGYPRVVPAVGSRGSGARCAALPFTRGDYRYISQVWHRLDRSIERAARRSRTEFIDAEKAGRFRHACSRRPWVNGAGDPATGATFHPSIHGIVGLKRLVTKTYREG